MSETVSTCFVFADFQFQPQMDREGQRVQLVNNLEPRFFARVVDAGDVEQVIEGKIVAAKFRDLAQIDGCNRVSRLAAKFGFRLQLWPEQFA